MYGWRGRIGYISAGTGEVAGEELFKAAPKGVEILAGNLFLNDSDRESGQVTELLDDMARRLGEKAEVDILVVAGYVLPAWTQGSRSSDFSDEHLIKHLENLIKRPVITGVKAQIEAMQALQVKRPAIIVPGNPKNFAGLTNYLEKSGFEIAEVAGLDVTPYDDPYRVPLHVCYRFAKEVFLQTSQADALLFPESTMPAAPQVATLERDLGIPVFLDSLCSLWSCMRRLRIGDSLRGWGSLLERSSSLR
jgi:maleate cis-trans isomerase